jgi:SAM-dependent methyltransferase
VTANDSRDEQLHLNRARAEAFGAVAGAYDAHRPTYPDALIRTLVTRPDLTVLDVGAGTGIASRQLRDAGANVVAVEPDSQMAAIARAGELTVQETTFEQWDPAGHRFDLVTFAQSFHWVEPVSAIQKAWEVLRPGGALALMWNRFTELDPPRDRIAEVDKKYLVDSVPGRPSEHREHTVDASLQATGFEVERHTFREERHYSREAWLDLLFTYSRYLVLDETGRSRVRTELATLVGPDGVRLENDALLVLARKPARAEPANRRVLPA